MVPRHAHGLNLYILDAAEIERRASERRHRRERSIVAVIVIVATAWTVVCAVSAALVTP